MEDLLKSKAISIEDKRKYFIGILVYTILDKQTFKRNEELKDYIKIIEDLDGVDIYKDYLYKSRTLLASRLAKDIKSILSDNQFLKLMKKHDNYFYNKNNEVESSIEKSKDSKKEERIQSSSAFSNYIKSKRKYENEYD